MRPVVFAAPAVADVVARPAIRLAVMIITRDRPIELARCIASLAAATCPAGCIVTWIVVDNAMPPQEADIRRLGRQANIDITYVHEPVRGYASPRNRAIGAALAADCDILLFVDDDVTAESDLLEAHVTGITSAAADISMGGQVGRSIGPGRRFRYMKVATFNVAFRRRLVDQNPGLALRFDPRLNLTGFEDFEFFLDAQILGARVIRNGDARVKLYDSAASITQKSMSDDVVATYFYASGRNLTYLRRTRHGSGAAWATALYLGATHGVRAAINTPIAVIAVPFSAKAATKAHRHVVQDTAFTRGLWHGLWKSGVERSAAKRGEIIEIPQHP